MISKKKKDSPSTQKIQAQTQFSQNYKNTKTQKKIEKRASCWYIMMCGAPQENFEPHSQNN